MWFNAKHDFAKLKVFWLFCICLDSNQKRKKLNSKSAKYTIVEYCSNGFSLCANKKIAVILSRDCNFDESSFPLI